MDLSRLNATDLTGANIGTFLTELENALAGNDYDKVKKAIEQINSFLITPGIINVTRTGQNTMEITAGGSTETVDINDIASQIVDRVKRDKETHDLTVGSPEEAKREEVVTEMNKFLTSMFNQDVLMQELARRHFSIDEFYRQMQRLNDESKVTIENLKREKEDKSKAFESVFGGDSTVKTGDYLSKAYPTRIKDCQEAVATLATAKTELERLKQARIDRAAETDPTKQTQLDSDIARHEANVKMLADKVKALNIPGIDPAFFTGWEEEAKIDASITSIDGVKHVAEVELNKNYTNLKNKVATLSDADKAKLGITPEIEDNFSKVDDLDPDVRKNARSAVDKYLKETQRTINVNMQEKIAIEERMIVLRDENVQRYREIQTKVADMQTRITIQMNGPDEVTRDKRRIDPNTGDYAIDPNTGDYVIEVDGSGNPLQEPVFEELTDRTKRDYYLQKAGFNRSQALERIDSGLFTRKQIRATLKAEGVGNPISRFFAPRRLWRRSRARANCLRGMENRAIELEQRKEYEEVVPGIESLEALEYIYERSKDSAAMQHALYSAGKDQGYDASSVDKMGVVDDLERAAYEEAFDRAAITGADEITELRKKKGDTHESLVKRHTKGSQPSAGDLIHRDDNNDMEL